MKKFLGIALVFSLLLAVCGCGGSQQPQGAGSPTAGDTSTEEQKFVIKLGHVRATDDPCNIALVGASERILERTNGNVEIQVYPNGELASYGDGIEAVRSDAAYIFYSSPGQFSDYVKDFVALQCPYLYDSFETYEALMDTPVIQKLTEQAEAQGIHTINLDFLTGFRFILTDKPITTVEDVKNLEIRLPNNRVWTEPFEAMDAKITCLAWSETYTALQQGVVKAIEGDPALIYNAKMYELKTVMSETNHLLDLSGTFIGTGYWNTLPQEYRDIITEEFNKASYENNRAYERLIEESRQKLTELGVEFHPVDMAGFQEATKHLVLQYDIGQELLDTLDSLRT